MISIITHFQAAEPERTDNLAFMLAWLQSRFSTAEIIVVEQDTETEMPEGVTRLPIALDMPHSKPACINAGVAAAANENILMLDPDTLFDPSLITTPASNVMRVPYFEQLALTPQATNQVLATNPATFDVADYISNNLDNGKGRLRYRACKGGVQFMTKTLFNAASGMNEAMADWPWDIIGFSNRVQKSGGSIELSNARALHLYHPFQTFQGLSI